MEAELKSAVQKNVKESLIESTYDNEPINFGQALVTYHYIQNAPIQTEFPENQTMSRRPGTAAAGRSNRKMSPAKQVLQHMESARATEKSGSPPNKSVQWDLVENRFVTTDKTCFGRKTVKTNEFSSISEALQLVRYEPIQREELNELK